MEISDKLILHCIIIGIFTILMGLLTEKTLSKYQRKNNFLSKLKHNYPLFIVSLFTFGIILHLLFEYSGFEAYCEKKCNDQNVCSYVCTIKMNVF